MEAATVLVATLLGFTFGGLNGACMAAVAAWVLALLAASVVERIRAEARSEEAGARHEALMMALGDIKDRLPKSPDFYLSVLDALPLDRYGLMETHEPRTQTEWEAGESDVWLTLRRRLVQGMGLSARRVDEARGVLLQMHFTQNPLPKSDGDLARVVKEAEEADKAAWDFLDALRRPTGAE